MTGSDHSRALAEANTMLDLSLWAAKSYGSFDLAAVRRIVRVVGEAAESQSSRYAEWAVGETGFGVVAHKERKNIACSRGVIDHYLDCDFVNPVLQRDGKILELPVPVGVVAVLTPSTSPIAALYFNVLLALLTRNVVVVIPHPLAQEVGSSAAQYVAEAAESAGAPKGTVQWISRPTTALVDSIMDDERVNLIVATGGSGAVRATCSSGIPALKVGGGNVPVFIEESADLSLAATRLVESKAFDNSILSTNESVLVTQRSVLSPLLKALERSHAHVLVPNEVPRIRELLFPGGKFDTSWAGKSALLIAKAASINARSDCQILVAPFDLVLPEEPLAHEKPCPVLGLSVIDTADQGIRASRAIVHIGGSGHSAAIHSNSPQLIRDFASQVPVLRISVNAGSSLGGAGIATELAPSMIVGTGFAERSSIREYLEPNHLIKTVRVAYNSANGEEMMAANASSPPAPRNSAEVPAYPRSRTRRSRDKVVTPATTSANQDIVLSVNSTADTLSCREEG